VLEYILQPDQYPELYGNVFHKVRINYYPPRGDNKEGWDNIDIFGWLGYPMQIKVDFLCRDSILAAPIVLDLPCSSTWRSGHGCRAFQEWLSFYFKSPQTAPGTVPEHDLFIQQTKLKNTLRWLMGEEQITPPRHRVLREGVSVSQYVVTAVGLAAIVWVLWYFLLSKGSATQAPTVAVCRRCGWS